MTGTSWEVLGRQERAWVVPGGSLECFGLPESPGVSSGVCGGFLEVTLFIVLGDVFTVGLKKY